MWALNPDLSLTLSAWNPYAVFALLFLETYKVQCKHKPILIASMSCDFPRRQVTVNLYRLPEPVTLKTLSSAPHRCGALSYPGLNLERSPGTLSYSLLLATQVTERKDDMGERV